MKNNHSDYMVHFSRNDRYIGDVHPYYDRASGYFYFYYLELGGKYESKCFRTSDFMNFEDFAISSDAFVTAPYYVLSVQKVGPVFRSYYGAGDHLASTTTKDLSFFASDHRNDLYFKNSDFLLIRDPSISVDLKFKKMYMVALAEFKDKTGYAITFHHGHVLNDFNREDRIIRTFKKEDHAGEPEVPQLFKVYDSSYLGYSKAGLTLHHVGGFTYLILPQGAYEDLDYTCLEEHQLTTMNLCAAQIVRKYSEAYIFGWIPQDYDKDTWGGILNYPLHVFAKKNNLLGTDFVDDVLENTIGDPLILQDKVTLLYNYVHIIRFDEEFHWEFDGATHHHEINFNEETRLLSYYSDGVQYGELHLDKNLETFTGDVRIIIDNDIVEINLEHLDTAHFKLSEKGPFTCLSNKEKYRFIEFFSLRGCIHYEETILHRD